MASDEAKREIEQIRMELQIYGFVAVKRIAELSKQTRGTMECPLCGQTLTFYIAASNGHCHASCQRQGCIRISE